MSDERKTALDPRFKNVSDGTEMKCKSCGKELKPWSGESYVPYCGDCYDPQVQVFGVTDQSTVSDEQIIETWIDPKTGRRVWRTKGVG